MTAAELQCVVELCWETPVEREIRVGSEAACERRWANRLWAAVQLSPALAVCEALIAGVGVPARRLDPAWVRTLQLAGDIVLDEALILRVTANGPLHGRRAA